MKRRVFKLLLLLFAGAIINVAVAWGFAGWGSFNFVPHQFCSRKQKPRWLCSVNYGFGMTRTSFTPDNGYWGGDMSSPDGFEIPYWSRINVPPSPETIADETMPWYDERAFGWPMRASIAELCARKPVHAWVAADAIEVLRRNDGSPMPFRVLPLRPIWPGFAVNTIFYATVLSVLFAVPGAIWRQVRRKRGQCAACGYSLRGTPHGEKCPECGGAA